MKRMYFADVCFGPKNLGLEQGEIRAAGRRRHWSWWVFRRRILSDSPRLSFPADRKRRVAIAGVLAMEPDILVLDEPTAGLDPKGRDEILGANFSFCMKETGMQRGAGFPQHGRCGELCGAHYCDEQGKA